MKEFRHNLHEETDKACGHVTCGCNSNILKVQLSADRPRPQPDDESLCPRLNLLVGVCVDRPLPAVMF